MGLSFSRRVGELGRGLPLAPERHDPRRRASGVGARRLGALVELVPQVVRAAELAALGPALVLDTGHALDGFVLGFGELVPAGSVRSAKRLLAPGDVLVSRLRPYLRQIAYVDEALFARAPGGNLVLASAEFYVLRRSSGLEPAALVGWLLSAGPQAAFAAAQEGAVHPRVPRDVLADLLVPDALLAEAEALADERRAFAGALRGALQGSAAQQRRFEG